DCRIDRSKVAKLEVGVGWLERVIHFKADGSKTVVCWNDANGTEQIKNLLINKFDWMRSGTVQGLSPPTLGAFSDKFVLLWYKSIGMIRPTEDGWDVVNANESNFVHVEGIEGYEGRIRSRQFCSGGGDGFITYPGQSWREYLASAINNVLHNDPRMDGAFLDVTLSKILSGERWWRFIEGEVQTVGDFGVITVEGEIHVDEGIYTCEAKGIDIVKVINVSGVELEVESHDQSSIVLVSGQANSGDSVYVDYYAVVDIPQQLKDSWNADMTETLKYIKRETPNHILVFNEILEGDSHPEDDQFPYIIDGCMMEHFVHTAWYGPDKFFDENSWKQQVDNLQEVSQTRIFSAYSGTDMSLTTEEQMKRIEQFCFASYLLGTGEYGYYSFNPNYSDLSTRYYFDYWATDVGEPLENYHLRASINGANIYEREFENVLVLVNPSEVSAAVDLGLNYKLLDGTVVQVINLDSHQGIILYKI
ncbi:MAG: hypothetical protein JSV03_05710, partial [Planctomycetota bacterium]